MWPLLFFIMFTNAVKALDKNLTLEVLGLPFGEDRQGQVFDANTNIGLQPGDAVPAFFWHGYAERNAGAVKSIGRAIYDRVDAAGHWFKVTLDNASDVALKIYEDAKAGLARIFRQFQPLGSAIWHCRQTRQSDKLAHLRNVPDGQHHVSVRGESAGDCSGRGEGID